MRRILDPVAATMLVAAAGFLATPAAPAAAAPAAAIAACPGDNGVTVIVDYNEIGGPTRAGCDPNGGGESAAAVFPAAGFALEYEPRQPGYVCRVTGLPTDRPCLANDSFWSLWWSDGESGRWVFSNQGVGGLEVPDGGYLAFSWHEGSGRAQAPDVIPTPHEATESPSQQPSHTNSGSPGGHSSSGNGGTSSSTTTTAPTSEATSSAATTPTSDPTKSDREKTESSKATPTGSSTVPGAAEITAGPPGERPTESAANDGGSLPTWIGLGLAAVALGAAGLVVLLRRRERSGPPA
ncbi:hypothetical protein F0U44_09115 [Nocardioides humilatus]|uniref:LPXTG cell wall anchor domain-containing protein n=1 Tax=Nocardioides humilatus TaxID=2607660 RepID=A0A5B1LEL1_9ACTN|nr:hypothetical protein [Nocardioides humilatus]KAA1418648.1 hypothetical protein F0U44_09115 [Nocardioides humilatus]